MKGNIMRGNQTHNGPLALISAIGGLLFFLCSTMESVSTLYSLFTSPQGVSVFLITIGSFFLIVAFIFIASYFFDYYLKVKHNIGKRPEPTTPEVANTLDSKVSKPLDD